MRRRYCYPLLYIVLAGWLFKGCNSAATNTAWPEKSDTALTDIHDIIRQPIADTVAHQPDESNGRILSAADKQKIDWLIPEDAEILFFEESAPETRRYAQQIYNRLLTRIPFGIIRNQVKKIEWDSIPELRFDIRFIGDHRYEVRVFDLRP